MIINEVDFLNYIIHIVKIQLKRNKNIKILKPMDTLVPYRKLSVMEWLKYIIINDSS